MLDDRYNAVGVQVLDKSYCRVRREKAVGLSGS
jgi:hypothetical protein